MPVYVKYRHKNVVARTAVCDGKILLKVAYREFGLRDTRITSSRLKNGHQSAPAYEAVRLTSYQYVRCVFWHYTRDRPSANIIDMVCSLHGDHLIQKSLSWEDKKKTKDIRQYRQQTPSSGAVFTHVLKKKNMYLCILLFFLWRCGPTGVMASSFVKFLDHTQRRTTVGRTPLDKWSARRRDLYLTTHNTHNRQMPMPPVGFEPTISAGERPQTYALDRAATGIGKRLWYYVILCYVILCDIMLCDIILQKCKCFVILFYILKWMKMNFQIMQMACFYMKRCTLNDKSNITVDWQN